MGRRENRPTSMMHRFLSYAGGLGWGVAWSVPLPLPPCPKPAKAWGFWGVNLANDPGPLARVGS